MRKLILSLLLACAPMAFASDIQIAPTGPVFKISSSLSYNTSGPGGLNNNFVFVPYYTNENACVYVKNNDTTSVATISISILATPDPSSNTPSDGSWNQVAQFPGLSAGTAPGFAAGLGINISGFASAAISVTSSSVTGGSPQTGQLILIQTTGVCPSANNINGSANSITPSTRPLQTVSQNQAQAYVVNATLTNPASGAQLLHINANGTLGSRSIYLDRIVVYASAAASVLINATSTVGTTCTNITPVSLHTQPTIVPSAVTNQACTVLPVVFGVVWGTATAPIPLIANTITTLDLTGFILQAGATQGLDITLGAALAAGTINATIFWYEL